MSLHRSVRPSDFKRTPQYTPIKTWVRRGSVQLAKSRSTSSGSRNRRRCFGSRDCLTATTGFSPSNNFHSLQRLYKFFKIANSLLILTRTPAFTRRWRCPSIRNDEISFNVLPLKDSASRRRPSLYERTLCGFLLASAHASNLIRASSKVIFHFA